MSHRCPGRAVASAALFLVALIAPGCGASSPTPSATPVSITVLSHRDQPGPKTESPTTLTTVAPASTTVAARVVTGPIKVMPLGDSITQGDDPADPSRPQSYRGYLAQRLQSAGYDVDFVGSEPTPTAGGADPDNEGHGGYTIGPDDSKFCPTCEPANLAAHVDAWLAASAPDVVLLLAGANDLLPIDPATAQGMIRPVQPADGAAKLTALVAQIRRASPTTVILVASQPPMSFFSGFPATEAAYRALNTTAASVAVGSDQVRYVPLFDSLFAGWVPATDNLADRLHPSQAGAAKIADVWFTALTPVLDQLRAG